MNRTKEESFHALENKRVPSLDVTKDKKMMSEYRVVQSVKNGNKNQAYRNGRTIDL